jgi:uncharacterized membrane protein YbhN (UPF0104 family)
MEETSGAGSKTGKLLKLLIKIVITALCLWYVSGKIDFVKAGHTLQDADWFYLVLAIIAFIISKIFSAIRLNIYFRNIGIYLPQLQNIRLYWLGMFYNLFLPGAISGDGYKVIILKKKFQVGYKKLMGAVILDRVSGLMGLVVILAIYSFPVLAHVTLVSIAVSAAIVFTVGLYLVNKYWLTDFFPGFWSTSFWGIAVQGMQVICAYLIMRTMGIEDQKAIFIFLFLLSSIVSVLPLTIGGLGIREVVFLEGSRYFALEQEQAVIISLIFYLITLLTSAAGAYFQFRNPIK